MLDVFSYHHYNAKGSAPELRKKMLTEDFLDETLTPDMAATLMRWRTECLRRLRRRRGWRQLLRRGGCQVPDGEATNFTARCIYVRYGLLA